MKELTCIAIFVILSAVFAAIMIAAGFICQYKKENAVKSSAYECGMQPISDARIQFDVKYFNYAAAFLIFDVETIFLYPFAVFVNALGVFAIVETLVFISILLFGLVFAVKKKFLRWI